jgi:hypothetical protein
MVGLQADETVAVVRSPCSHQSLFQSRSSRVDDHLVDWERWPPRTIAQTVNALGLGSTAAHGRIQLAVAVEIAAATMPG